jgi:hypothetical protein
MASDTGNSGGKADILSLGQTAGPFGNDPFAKAVVPDATILKVPSGK